MNQAKLLDLIAYEIAKDIGNIPCSYPKLLYQIDSPIGIEATRRVALHIVPMVAALVSITESGNAKRSRAIARGVLDKLGRP